MSDDPTEVSSWRPLRLLQAELDEEIAAVYERAAISGVRTSWVMELLRLHYRGPMTIAELAVSVERTHSAISQKVAAMRAAGLVRTTPGVDARTRRIALTPKARGLVGQLAAEWSATEAVMAELADEVPYPIDKVVDDLREALRHRSFRERLEDRLGQDPAWPSGTH